MSRADDIAARLEEVVADLDELALDNLRDAVADGRNRRPPSDRQLTQARRAVEKAVLVLRRMNAEDADHDRDDLRS